MLPYISCVFAWLFLFFVNYLAVVSIKRKYLINFEDIMDPQVFSY